MNFINFNNQMLPLQSFNGYDRLAMHNFNDDVSLVRTTANNSQFLNNWQELYTRREFLNSRSLQSLDYISLDYRIVMQQLDQELWDISSAIHAESKLHCFGCLLGILTSVSAATQGNYRIHIEYFNNWYEAAVLQIFQFAPSGFMKSAVCEILLRPFMEFQTGMQTEFINNNYQRKIEIAKQIKKKVRKELIKHCDFDNIPNIEDIIKKEDNFNNSIGIYNDCANPKIISTPSTYLGMLKELNEQNESIFFASSESPQLLALLDKENYGLILKGYGYEAESYKTGRTDINLINPSVYILGFSQLEVAKKLYLKQKLNSIGVLSRFMPLIHSGVVNDNYYKINLGCVVN